MTELDLGSFERSLASLQRALQRSEASPQDEELRDACIQRFEYTFELAWKMLKRRLERDLPGAAELDSLSFRSLMRVAAEQGLIDDPAPWFVHRERRNLTSHTYNAAKAAEVRAALPAFAADAAALLWRLQVRGQLDG
jgi:nucleotidyltransferase substrate binding protein (TIGR01987 family)